jgi:tetratricopeptide (TPR) repeat protein
MLVKHKEQTFYILGAVILLAVLYFGFDNKPSTQKVLEKSRALTAQTFDISTLQAEAKKSLKEDQIQYLEALEAQVAHAGQDSTRIRILKQLSGYWFGLQNPVIAGMYAKEIAELENTGESWAITGTTFAAGLQQEGLTEEKKLFARDQALGAFENAISLEPGKVEYRVNQALCYIEAPAAGEPMKGIQMLAGLATNYPDSPVPPYHLARLAVRTGQYDRAKTRIEQALQLAPSDSRIACLAIEIYTALNQPEEAKKLKDVCAGTQ